MAHFAEIDHSGDVGIEASGATLAELLQHLTEGLTSLMCRGRIESKVVRRINVRSSSLEDLVVDWLGDVITTVGARGELYGSVAVERTGEHFAEGVLRGEPVDPKRHDLRFDVKAATYHGLVVEERERQWHARVIFDL